MQLFRINPMDGEPVSVVAPNANEASNLFITWTAANDRHPSSFTVDDLSIEALEGDEHRLVHEALDAGLAGIVHHDESEWTFSPPLWQPTDAEDSSGEDEDRPPVLRIFEMRDLTPIEAIVLAYDYDSASVLFEGHLRAHGGNPDAVLYREVQLTYLDEPRNDAVYAALEFGGEGLVTSDAHGRWAFTIPLGVS